MYRYPFRFFALALYGGGALVPRGCVGSADPAHEIPHGPGGDGEPEYILKWDPSNSKDVSRKGYTGNCLIGCCTLSGILPWRLDMGKNIRSGAHYTQFMIYDPNGDGKAEMAVKTASGTRMTVYAPDGQIIEENYITLPEKDAQAGIRNTDNYVGSAQDYREHLVSLFMGWQERPEVRGLQVWVREMRNCDGSLSALPTPGTNASIRWAGGLTTQVTDGVNYVHEKHTGIINDPVHGILLKPEGTSTNNGTKGNPCLVADVPGDFRDNLILRLTDDSAPRVFVNTEVTRHKLYTLLHDVQYRRGVAWQNDCCNQPVWPSFYYGSDMDFRNVFSRL